MEDTKKSVMGKVLGFLAMEILAIISFSLGNSFIFFSIIGVVLLMVSIIITFKQINSSGLSTFLFFLFPIIVFGILCALSMMRLDNYFNLQGGLVAFIPVGLGCFSAIGYFLSICKDFKIKYALIVIYSALSILVLINLVATFVDFGFLHTILLKGKYIYYDGKPSASPVSDMTMALMGFSMSEVSVRYFSLFPSILLSAFVPLFFMNRKEEKKSFYLYLAFGILGSVSLILLPNKWTLLTDVLVVVILALLVISIRFNFKKKKFFIPFIVVVSLIAIGLILLYMNAQKNPIGLETELQNFIKSVPLFNKLFNANGLVAAFNCALDGLFTNQRILGTPIHNYPFEYPKGMLKTGSWLFDTIYTSGFFGLAFFIFILVIGIRRMMMYYSYSDDKKSDKMAIFGFVFAFLGYTLLNYDLMPFVFEKTVIPMYECGPFLVVIFLMSYCFSKSEDFSPKKKVEEPQASEETSIVEEEANVNEEEISL